jgi:hypothetical protein
MSRIQCPHCGKGYQLSPPQRAQLSGRSVTCKQCHKSFTVSGEDEPELLEIVDPQPPPATPPPAPLPRASPSPGAIPASPYVGFNRPRTVVEDRTNGWAVASRICGFVGLIVPVVPAVLAIVFGVLAFRKTRDSRYGGQGAAMTGIILAVCGMLAHGCAYIVLVPRLDRAREVANRVECSRHMRDIGRALLAYARTNNNILPARLEDVLSGSTTLNGGTFVCPSSRDAPATGSAAAVAQALHTPGHCSYLYFGGHPIGGTSNTVIIMYEPLDHHRGDGINLLMENGEVWWVNTRTAQRIISELQLGFNPPRPPPMGWRDD